MNYLEIEKVIGREIMDSRGNPTVEAEVYLADGSMEEEPLPAAHLPESLKPWNCVMEIKAAISAKVFPKQWKTSIPPSMTC